MRQYNHSRGSIFLLELLINILLFTLLLVVGLKFFFKAHMLTEKTTDLHNSVTACVSAATLFEQGDGSLNIFLNNYENVDFTGNKITVFYDKNYIECSREQAAFFLDIILNDSSNNMDSARILMRNDREVLYEIEACHYMQLTPSAKEVP